MNTSKNPFGHKTFNPPKTETTPKEEAMGNFAFSETNSLPSWFSYYFEEGYSIFSYINSYSEYEEYRMHQPLWYRFLNRSAPKFKIISIINLLSHLRLMDPSSEQRSSMMEDLFKEMNREKPKLVKFLNKIHKSAKHLDRKKNRFFNGLSKFSQIPVWPWEDYAFLDKEMVAVRGQLIYRDVIAQYNLKTKETLSHSSGNWILSHVSPHGMHIDNKRYEGDLLLLKEDEGFTQKYMSTVPFWTQTGWYPYLRVTGLSDFKNKELEKRPALLMMLVEYREAKKWSKVGREWIEFLNKELSTPIHLKTRPELITAAYMAPFLTNADGLSPNSLDAETEKATLVKLRSKIENEPHFGLSFPKALGGWYDELSR